MIPYNVNSYTAGVFPMKLYEYLAAGNAVVSTSLPSLRHLSLPYVSVSSDLSDFLEAVKKSIQLPTEDDVSLRRETAYEHSWEARMTAVLTLLDELRYSKRRA
jgi:hypothetical protein